MTGLDCHRSMSLRAAISTHSGLNAWMDVHGLCRLCSMCSRSKIYSLQVQNLASPVAHLIDSVARCRKRNEQRGPREAPLPNVMYVNSYTYWI